MPEQAYKTCRGCDESQSLDRFSRHPQMGDGHLNFCKDCVSRKNRKRYLKNKELRKKQAADWRRANPERSREADRLWKRRNPKRAAENNRRSDERHPEKARARKLLTQAVRVGRVSKPKHCQDCGEEKTPRRLHGHHEDYSKPYDVNWLCPGCHARRHRA